LPDLVQKTTSLTRRGRRAAGALRAADPLDHRTDGGPPELSVEPANDDVPVDEVLAKLPEGNYTIAGPAQENGESAGRTSGSRTTSRQARSSFLPRKAPPSRCASSSLAGSETITG